MSSTQGSIKPNLRWTFGLVVVAIALALGWLALNGGSSHADSGVENPATMSLSQAHLAPADIHLRRLRLGLQVPVSAAATTQADSKTVPNDSVTLLVLAATVGLTLAVSVMLLARKVRGCKRLVTQNLNLTLPSPVPGT